MILDVQIQHDASLTTTNQEISTAQIATGSGNSVSPTAQPSNDPSYACPESTVSPINKTPTKPDKDTDSASQPPVNIVPTPSDGIQVPKGYVLVSNHQVNHPTGLTDTPMADTFPFFLVLLIEQQQHCDYIRRLDLQRPATGCDVCGYVVVLLHG
jgi:hypothetical protein